MVNNPARFFVSANSERKFTYEGGTTLFHWSPYESGLSGSMESNVIFFANSADHAREVLCRMFEFWVSCNAKYMKSKDGKDDNNHTRIEETRVLRSYLENMDKMVIAKAPVNQFYQVGWACNDNLRVHAKVGKN